MIKIKSFAYLKTRDEYFQALMPQFLTCYDKVCIIFLYLIQLKTLKSKHEIRIILKQEINEDMNSKYYVLLFKETLNTFLIFIKLVTC